MLHSMLDPRYWNADLSMPLLKVRSAWLCDPRKLNTEEMGTQHMLSCTKERSYTGCRHSKILSVRWWIREIGYRLWRRALLQGGGCEGLLLGLGVGDSIPSALSRKFLSLSENFGLGIPAAKDLNSGVTWRGELNSVLDKLEATTSLVFGSSQEGKISAWFVVVPERTPLTHSSKPFWSIGIVCNLTPISWCSAHISGWVCSVLSPAVWDTRVDPVLYSELPGDSSYKSGCLWWHQQLDAAWMWPA